MVLGILIKLAIFAISVYYSTSEFEAVFNRSLRQISFPLQQICSLNNLKSSQKNEIKVHPPYFLNSLFPIITPVELSYPPDTAHALSSYKFYYLCFF